MKIFEVSGMGGVGKTGLTRLITSNLEHHGIKVMLAKDVNMDRILKLLVASKNIHLFIYLFYLIIRSRQKTRNDFWFCYKALVLYILRFKYINRYKNKIVTNCDVVLFDEGLFNRLLSISSSARYNRYVETNVENIIKLLKFNTKLIFLDADFNVIYQRRLMRSQKNRLERCHLSSEEYFCRLNNIYASKNTIRDIFSKINLILVQVDTKDESFADVAELVKGHILNDSKCDQ